MEPGRGWLQILVYWKKNPRKQFSPGLQLDVANKKLERTVIKLIDWYLWLNYIFAVVKYALPIIT